MAGQVEDSIEPDFVGPGTYARDLGFVLLAVGTGEEWNENEILGSCSNDLYRADYGEILKMRRQVRG